MQVLKEEEEKEPDVLIFTTSGCPFCKRAKQFLLKKKKVRVREVELTAQNPNTYNSILSFLQSLNNGNYQMPQIFINGEKIGVCTFSVFSTPSIQFLFLQIV